MHSGSLSSQSAPNSHCLHHNHLGPGLGSCSGSSNQHRCSLGRYRRSAHRGRRVDLRVTVVAIKSKATFALTKPISIGVHVTSGRALGILAATVLIDVVTADFGRPRVHVGILVIAVKPVTAAADSESIDVIVLAVHQARGIATGAVIVLSISTALCLAGIHVGSWSLQSPPVRRSLLQDAAL